MDNGLREEKIFHQNIPVRERSFSICRHIFSFCWWRMFFSYQLDFLHWNNSRL